MYELNELETWKDGKSRVNYVELKERLKGRRERKVAFENTREKIEK